MIRFYANDDIAKDKHIKIDKDSVNIEIISDRTILRRIIANIIKNAYEATPKGGTITIGCDVINDDKIEFWVHNPGYIPQDIQMQIFQRSFSTKDLNRGIGTYSMKLLSSFLDGSINFTSTEENGTKFRAIYPLNLKS